MATADNAVYTPDPKTIQVVRYRDYTGGIKTIAGSKRYLRADEEFISEELAIVIDRGSLINEQSRWYEVRLADGSTHMVRGEGS